jgi:hypothetical protein
MIMNGQKMEIQSEGITIVRTNNVQKQQLYLSPYMLAFLESIGFIFPEEILDILLWVFANYLFPVDVAVDGLFLRSVNVDFQAS